MKQILIIIFILAIFTYCLANETEMEFSSSPSLLEISQKANIPVKKLAEYLDRSEISDYSKTLTELNINSDELKQAIKRFEQEKKSFYSGVVLVGMSIVFGSLIIIGLVIASLEHMNKKAKPKKKTVKTSFGKVSAAPEHISSNGIVAAITALYLHEMEVEEQNRLHLTWKRQPLSMWRATNMVENRFFDNKRG